MFFVAKNVLTGWKKPDCRFKIEHDQLSNSMQLMTLQKLCSWVTVLLLHLRGIFCDVSTVLFVDRKRFMKFIRVFVSSQNSLMTIYCQRRLDSAPMNC